MGKFKKMMEVSSNVGNYSNADEGEPDTGFIRGNKKRKLGTLAGKPEPWFERGGYTQTQFPKADFIYGKGEEEDFAVRKTAYVAQIDKDFEAHFEKWEDWVAGDDFEEQNSEELKESKYNRAMKYSLLERVDFFDNAQQLVKQYGLKSKIKFTAGSQLAEYVPETDTIYLRRSYKTTKEFLETILHEIKHALDRKKMGVKKYERAYAMAGEIAVQKGGDFHDDNKFEEIAERWGIREYQKLKNKI